MFRPTQCSRDAITVTWKTRHFRHFTSEHYKVSKIEVFEQGFAEMTPLCDHRVLCSRCSPFNGVRTRDTA